MKRGESYKKIYEGKGDSKVKQVYKVTAIIIIALLVMQNIKNTGQFMQVVYADDVSENDTSDTTDPKANAYTTLASYANNLILINQLDATNAKKITDILASAKEVIDDWNLSANGELSTYVTTVEAQMDAVISALPATTSDFLALADNYQTPTVQYGDTVTITLPVISYAEVALSDIMVKPEISNLVAEWPFEPDAAGATKSIQSFPAYDSTKDMEDVRQDISFTFQVRDDVLSGYYPLKFDFTYNRKGTVEKATLVTYVKTVGEEGSGSLDSQSSDTNSQTSKPRIIVTGFSTEPEKISAGDTFTVTIHVENTSQDEAVQNVLFDLQAADEGTDKTDTYAAFLPTSGASSVYFDTLAAKQSKDIVMEMTARSDLSEKPYVLDVNMKYDCQSATDVTDTASVSIPVYQVARCETGDAEVLPTSIAVGEQADVTFDVYNTGKTTLNNVWVKFQADSVTGGDTYLGNISAGATGSVDAMLTGALATTDDGVVKAEISYENEAGDVSTVEKDITLMVQDASAESGSYTDTDYNANASDISGGILSKAGSHTVYLGIMVLLVVAIFIGGIIFYKRKRKKRKKQEEWEAEQDDIAEIEQNREGDE